MSYELKGLLFCKYAKEFLTNCYIIKALHCLFSVYCSTLGDIQGWMHGTGCTHDTLKTKDNCRILSSTHKLYCRDHTFWHTVESFSFMRTNVCVFASSLERYPKSASLLERCFMVTCLCNYIARWIITLFCIRVDINSLESVIITKSTNIDPPRTIF